MEGVQSKAPQDPSSTKPRGEKSLMIAQVSLRSLVIICTLAASCLIFTSKQTTIVYGIPFDASYSYEPAFQFFGIANVAVCVLCLLSLGTVFFLSHRLANFFLFLHDLVVLTVLMAACAGSTAVGQIGRNGNTHSSWMPICDHFAKFCTRVATSVAFSYLAVLMFFALTVLSALRIQAKPI
ncbi:CASP-like protein 1F1 isoform X1 [Macadamia integrifolia]|uniref:CASP-like protein 1F1 isoform X1 n=1 Tax=Macadamia integrifolia TaxID=60698 RepID=UPI001C4F074F|nr:CASP-like protein 1F1 isoform X1 [Macadamia integrifolia]